MSFRKSFQELENEGPQPSARPNDKERGKLHVSVRAPPARSSSSVSLSFGGSMKREFISTEIVILSSDEGGRMTPLLPVAYRGQYRKGVSH